MSHTELVRLGSGDGSNAVLSVLESHDDLLAQSWRGELASSSALRFWPVYPWISVALEENSGDHDQVLRPYLLITLEPQAVARPIAFARELLIYAAPRIADMEIPKIRGAGAFPDAKTRWHKVRVADYEDKRKSKEATGETYQQRSKLCYADLRGIAHGLWCEVGRINKKFTHDDLTRSPLKRRVYESEEWDQAIAFGEGDGYWKHVNPAYTMKETYELEKPKMPLLGASLQGEANVAVPNIDNLVIFQGLSSLLTGDSHDSVAQDCREINAAAEAGLAKCVITLCGGVVEALLLGLLSGDEKGAQAEAGRMSALPEYAKGKKQLSNASKEPLDRWNACTLIMVAREMNPDLVNADAVAFADVLRDYRNLIHPGKAQRSQRTANPHIATIAITVVNLIIAGMAKGHSGSP